MVTMTDMVVDIVAEGEEEVVVDHHPGGDVEAHPDHVHARDHAAAVVEAHLVVRVDQKVVRVPVRLVNVLARTVLENYPEAVARVGAVAAVVARVEVEVVQRVDHLANLARGHHELGREHVE
uniref:Uncharacterized protein n=1 Tax=Clytia hemisphaerica TaxID=252671 RepID=A0A7M5UVY8_9CNID